MFAMSVLLSVVFILVERFCAMIFSHDDNHSGIVVTAELDEDTGRYDHLCFAYVLIVISERLREAGKQSDAEALLRFVSVLAQVDDSADADAPSFDVSIEDLLLLVRALFASTCAAMGPDEFSRISSHMLDAVLATVEQKE